MEFEWNATKAETNERKHGVSFEVATLVFEDDERIDRIDLESSEEERWVAIGIADEFGSLCRVRNPWAENSDDFCQKGQST